MLVSSPLQQKEKNHDSINASMDRNTVGCNYGRDLRVRRMGTSILKTQNSADNLRYPTLSSDSNTSNRCYSGQQTTSLVVCSRPCRRRLGNSSNNRCSNSDRMGTLQQN